ncbi:MAG: NAD kinase [Cytophagales bacterium]|nr:NAD kinase [Cytophagales bacterium]
MKVAIHGKVFPQNTIPVIEFTLSLLNNNNYDVCLSKSFYDQAVKNGIELYNCGNYTLGTSFSDYDFVISIGGDGTLLETVTHVGRSEKPILGLNTGRLGFLATTNREMIAEAIQSIERKDYEIDSRMLVKVESSEKIFDELNYGLNEVTVLKQDTSSMITVHAYINNEFLNSYWADGLIIATPTGSTGYSLSCGGPVVMPHSNNLIITPVSPHNLNVRPLIVSDSCNIRLEVESRSNYFMTSLDSRSVILKSGMELRIIKESFEAKLIKFDGYSFVNTLRKKLNWGLDARN